MHCRYSRVAVCALAAALLAGCREEPRSSAPRSTPPPSAEGTGGDLQPLTSRDPASGDAPAPSTLPPGHPPLDASAPPALPADAGGSVSGTLETAAAHKSTIEGGAIYFIARNPARQIVAVRRSESVELPQKFQLSAADAMVAGTAFEGPLDITARWSQRGDAMPAAGDIEGVARGVAVGAKNVKIVLSDVRK
jgi:hypothetical protein